MTATESIQMYSTIITGVGVLIALSIAIVQYRMIRQQMSLNFFSDYTKRYQQIFLNFPVNINDPEFSFDKLKPEIKENTLIYMRVYFDLCSEEYFLHSIKKIDKKIWKEWSSGIIYTFSKAAFRDGWRIINLDTDIYKDFCKWINNEVIKE